MKVREMVAWLAQFADQDAEIEVICHSSGTGHYDPFGTVTTEPFDPAKHAEYTDMCGNSHVPHGAPYENARTLLLGLKD